MSTLRRIRAAINSGSPIAIIAAAMMLSTSFTIVERSGVLPLTAATTPTYQPLAKPKITVRSRVSATRGKSSASSKATVRKDRRQPAHSVTSAGTVRAASRGKTTNASQRSSVSSKKPVRRGKRS